MGVAIRALNILSLDKCKGAQYIIMLIGLHFNWLWALSYHCKNIYHINILVAQINYVQTIQVFLFDIMTVFELKQSFFGRVSKSIPSASVCQTVLDNFAFTKSWWFFRFGNIWSETICGSRIPYTVQSHHGSPEVYQWINMKPDDFREILATLTRQYGT